MTLFVSLLLVGLVSVGMSLGVASRSGMRARGAERAITYDESGALGESDAMALYSFNIYFVEHLDSFVTVVAVIQQSDNASPPPGLSSWPARGEVYVSPELRRIDPDNEVASLYGDVVGTIGDEGLVSPREVLIYTYPDSQMINEGAFYPALGYWGADQGAEHVLGETDSVVEFGDSLDLAPVGQFISGYTIAIGIPLLALVAVSVATGRSHRRAQSQRLYVLGYGAAGQVRWHAGKLWAPLGAAMVVTGAVVAVLSLWQVTVPVTGFVISPEDVRSHLGWIAGGALAAMAAYCVLWLLTSLDIGTRWRKGERRGATSQRLEYRSSRLALLVAGIPLMYLASRTVPDENPMLSFGLFVAGLLLVIYSLGDVVRFVVAVPLKRLRTRAAHRGDPETLVAAANLQSHGGTLVTMSVLLASATLGFSLVNSMLVAWNAPDPEAHRVFSAFRDRAYTTSINSWWTDEHTSVVDSALEDAESVGVVALVTSVSETDGLEGATTVTWDVVGDAPVGNEKEIEELVRHTASFLLLPGQRVTYRQAPPLEQISADVDAMRRAEAEGLSASQELLFMAPPGELIDQLDLFGAFIDQRYPMPMIRTPASDLVFEADENESRTTWMTLMASVGLAIMMIGVGMALSDERYDGTGRLAALSGLAGRPVKVARMSLLRVTLPIMSGVGAGVAVAIPINVMLDDVYKVITMPVVKYSAIVLGAAVVLSIVMSAALTLISRERMSSWRS